MADDDGKVTELRRDGDDDTPPIRYMESGAIRMTLADGSELRLRRPRWREFRQLRESLHEINDDVADKSTELQIVAKRITAQIEELDTDTEDGMRAVNKFRAESNEQSRKFTDEIEALRLGWLDQMVATLGQRKVRLLDDDTGEPTELADGWMADSKLPSGILTHWLSVPLPSPASVAGMKNR